MREKLRASTIGIVVCTLVGLAIGMMTQLGVLAAQQSSGPTTSSLRLPATKQAPAMTFKSGDMGEIEIGDGIELGFTDYTAADGIWLRVLYLTKTDQAEAVAAFNQRIAHATKVIKRSEKRDANGRVIGERAQILAPLARPAPPYHAVIWTDGPTFHEIGSPSLQHVLQFEREYRH